MECGSGECVQLDLAIGSFRKEDVEVVKMHRRTSIFRSFVLLLGFLSKDMVVFMDVSW